MAKTTMVGQLMIEMAMNTASLKADADEAKATISSMSASMTSALETVSTILGTLGVAMAATGIVEMGKKAIDSGDQLLIFSQRTGIAVEQLHGLEFAAKLNGSSLESVSTAVKKLSTYLFEAESGGKAQQQMLQMLGITAKEPMDAMYQLSDAISKMTSHTDQSAVMVKILGKAGSDLIPVLMSGGEGLKSMVDEGNKLNPVTQQFAENANQLNDDLDRLKELSSATGRKMVEDLLPAGSKLIETFIAASQEGGKLNAMMVTLGMVLTNFSTGTEFATPVQKLSKALQDMQKEQSEILRTQNAIATTGLPHWMIDGMLADKTAELNKVNQEMLDTQSKLAELQKVSEAAKPQGESIAAKIKAQEEQDKADKAAAKSMQDSITATDSLISKLNQRKSSEEGVSQAMMIAAEIDDTKIRPAQAQRIIQLAQEVDRLAELKIAQQAHVQLITEEFNQHIRARDSYDHMITSIKAEIDAQHLNAAQIATNNAMRSLEALGLRAGTEEYDKQREAILKLQNTKLASAEFANPAAQEMQRYQQRIALANQYALDSEDGARRHAQILEQIEEEHDAKLTQLAQAGQINRAQFESMGMKGQYDTVGGLLKNSLGQAAQHNKTMFESNKQFSAADAIVSTLTGMTKALQLGPIGIPLAAIIGAAGFANVAAIESASFGGGGASAPSASGGSGSIAGQTANPSAVASTSTLTTAATAPQSQFNMYIPEGVIMTDMNKLMREQIAPAFNQFVSDGGVIMNVRSA
jgi:hypothetical protein